MKRWFLALFFAVLLLDGCQQHPAAPVDRQVQLALPAPEAALIAPEYQSMRSAAINRISLEPTERVGLWQMPEGAWIHQLGAVDELTLGMSYSPLPDEGINEGFAPAGIYTMALNDTVLEPLLLPESPNVSFFSPIWTPDGRYLFYVRHAQLADAFDVTLMRYELVTGEHRVIAQDGVWPRVSEQGDRLTYITVDPLTQERGIYLSDLDGANVVELVSVGMYYDVDTPLFSSDGTQVYFTASLAGRKLSWLDWLFGVRTAYAHADANVPVEWLRVSVDGGEHEVLSAESKRIIYGDLSADGQHIYFSTLDGFYSMPISGGPFTQHTTTPTIRTFIHDTFRLR